MPEILQIEGDRRMITQEFRFYHFNNNLKITTMNLVIHISMKNMHFQAWILNDVQGFWSLLQTTLHLPASKISKRPEELWRLCHSLQEFTTFMCALRCIDLFGAASQTCLSEHSEDKETRQYGHSHRIVQSGYRALFTPPSPWKPSIDWAWRVTTNPALEERVRFRPSSKVDRQKETFSFFAMTKTKSPTAVILQLTALSLSHGSSVKVQVKQARTDYLPLCVFAFNERCHSHLSIAIHFCYRSHLFCTMCCFCVLN